MKVPTALKASWYAAAHCMTSEAQATSLAYSHDPFNAADWFANTVVSVVFGLVTSLATVTDPFEGQLQAILIQSLEAILYWLAQSRKAWQGTVHCKSPVSTARPVRCCPFCTHCTTFLEAGKGPVTNPSLAQAPCHAGHSKARGQGVCGAIR